ncbi:CAAX prenyl protease-related protein [Desulforhabdus sp. TSK]|uniref:CAAX prenyl protease-related protein n=1 Tax=Desulforhabdus sp. TSK TaxID=2925014 RepID=UPI001FC8C649|nr:CAAX prenyl protease-related protein [Desulforhabdus sp. TSK]GKT08816.1 CAAX prenyl protease-related protein [Desulforhabdus sp. TSK]
MTTPPGGGTESSWLKGPAFPRILPFALFMAFIGVEELWRFLEGQGIIPSIEGITFYLYPIKALSTGAALLYFLSSYTELKWRDLSHLPHTLLSAGVGVFVFALWINLDYAMGEGAKGFDPTLLPEGIPRTASIAMRLLGAAVIVPVMEEIFWRSFLIRYIVDKDFDRLPIGHFTWMSFAVSSVLFGLEHHLIVAGIVAGVIYNLLLYRTRSIAQCILAHGITNLALGIYVLQTGRWDFW